MVKKSGFTLIELLVVISIIAVLSTIGLTTYSDVQSSARDSVRKQDLNTLATALELYYQKNSQYIPPASSAAENCSRDTDKFYIDITTFINGASGAPKDPRGDKYCYISINNGKSYRLFAKLENCQGSGGNLCDYTYNYSVVSEDLTIASAMQE